MWYCSTHANSVQQALLHCQRHLVIRSEDLNAAAFGLNRVAAKLHHIVDLNVMVHRIMVEESQLFDIGIYGRINYIAERTVSPALLAEIFRVRVLSFANVKVHIFRESVDLFIQIARARALSSQCRCAQRHP